MVAPRITVAWVLVGVLVTPIPDGLVAQLGLRNLLIMNAAVLAPGSISPDGNSPFTVYPAAENVSIAVS